MRLDPKEFNEHRLCQSCQTNPAVKKVSVMKGRGIRWKCLTCIKQRGTSFLLSHKARDATLKRKAK